VAEIPSALLPNEALPVSEEMPQALGDTPIVTPTGNVDGNLMSLYDHKNGTVLAIEPTEAETYLKTGQYTLPKGTRVNVVDENGEAASVDSSEVYNALQSGYRMEQPQETEQRRAQEKYGGVGGQAAALAAGALRGASFGISDQLYVGAGGEPETLRGLEEANPASSIVGEATGIIAPAIFTGGASTVAGAGVKGAAAAGRAAERLIAKQAIKAGLSNPLAKSIATKIVPAFVGNSVEGTFYGAGQLLSEDALGKADLNAENLAAYIGTGALLNGAFGAAFSGAGQVLDSKIFKGATRPIADYVEGFTARDKAALDVLGYTPAKAAKLAEKNPELKNSLADILVKNVGMSVDDDAVTLAAKISKLKDDAGKSLESVLTKADDTMKSQGRTIDSELLYKDLADKLEQRFLGGKNLSSPEYRSIRKEVDNYYSEILKSSQEGGRMSLKDLHFIRKGADSKGYAANGMPVDSIEGQMARFARRHYDDVLKQTMANTGDDSLRAAFSDANKLYSFAAEVGPKINLKASKTERLNPFYATILGGAAGQMLGDGDASSIGIGAIAGLAGRSFLMSDLRRNLVILGKIEQGRQAVGRAVNSTVKAFGEGTRSAARAAQTSVPSIVNSSLAQNYSNGKSEKPRTKEQAYNNILNNINSFTASPTSFMEKANRQTASLYKAAPQTSAQLDNLAMTAMTYLSTKAPKRNENINLLTAFRPVPLPSTQELAKFARILNAVEKPMDVLKNLERGTASREEMEVLKDVYPSTFAELQETFMAELPKLQKTMPYNRRVQMGLLLGVPADASMLPQNILGLQNLFQTSPDQGGGVVNPTVGGLKELGGATGLLTPLQQAQAGLGDD